MKTKFARIYLVRHGNVVNKKKIIYGYLPVPLSPTGKREAKRAGLFLKKQNIAAIFSSPQKRTQQTARIINQVISKGRLKITTDKKLRETGYGRLMQGLTEEEVAKKHPKERWLYFRQPAKLKKGETLAKMAERMLNVIQKGIKKYPGQNLVFVSHRDPILAVLLKTSKRSFNDLHKVKHFCSTGSVLEVDFIGRRLVNKNF